MNEPREPQDEPVTSAAAKCCTDVEQRVRRNPGTAILIAVGTGLVVGLLVRALRPNPTAGHRVTRMLEDIERRVRTAAGPAVRKAGALVGEGAEAVSEGWHTGEARLGRLFREGRSRLSRLWSKS